MKRLLLLLVILASPLLTVCAQQKYWIYFKDKTESISPSSLDDDYDLPVSGVYIDSLETYDICQINTSRWLNAMTAVLTNQQQGILQRLAFISAVEPVKSEMRVLSDGFFSNNALALQQIHADTLLQLGYNGAGVKIGIIDGGFLGADEEDLLEGIISEKQIGGYKNFIHTEMENPFAGKRKHRDDHGTKVWKLIGGYSREDREYTGLATEATYYLARTDQGDKEYRGEEDNWIAALEWMYDQGVRLVNSSLGYSTGFDNAKENYSPADADGKSAAITRAANIAVAEKGMLLVISAGNDGSNKFKVVSIPADAAEVISVGSTGFKTWKKQYYSSTGPETLEYVKPDVACYSMTGTSFSAPVITGVMACLMQAYGDRTPAELMKSLKESGHLSNVPNNYLGYGVPDVRKILKGLNGTMRDSIPYIIHSQGSEQELTFHEENVMAFHKTGPFVVMKQEELKSHNDKVTVSRFKNARRTTVASPDRVYEIIWD